MGLVDEIRAEEQTKKVSLLDEIKNEASAQEQPIKPTWESTKGEFITSLKGIGNVKQMITEKLGKAMPALQRRDELMAKAVDKGMNSLTPKEQKEITDYVIGFGSMGMHTTAKTAISKTAEKIIPKGKVRTTIGEDIGGRLNKFIDTMSEKIPFSGMGRFRKLQQLEADDAAKQFLSKYIANPTAPDIAQGNAEYIANLYETMQQTARTGNVKVVANATKTKTQNLLDDFPTVFEAIQDNRTKKILKNIVGDIKDITKISPIVTSQGKPITTKITPEFDFDTLWELRKGLGQAADDASTPTAKRILTKVKHAVSDDMENLFANTNTEASQMFKTANEAYKKFEIKYKQVQEAYDYASGVKGAGDVGFFSPQKFGTKLKNLAYKEKLKGGYSAWTPGEITEATGLANIMQVVKRAGQYMENPPTGNRLSDLWIIGLAIKTPLIPVSWVTTFLNTTKMGKSLMKTAATVNPSSYKMKAIMLTIYNTYNKSNNIQEEE